MSKAVEPVGEEREDAMSDLKWYCPGCGKIYPEEASKVSCPSCGRSMKVWNPRAQTLEQLKDEIQKGR